MKREKLKNPKKVCLGVFNDFLTIGRCKIKKESPLIFQNFTTFNTGIANGEYHTKEKNDLYFFPCCPIAGDLH